MKRIASILALVALVAVIYSIIPVASLYLEKEPAPYTNEQAIERLKDNKGDYFAFVVLGDNHAGFLFNDSAFLKLIRYINREDRFKKIPVDFTIIAGDVTSYRGSDWEYRIYNKLRSVIRWPVFSAIGNHDDDKGGAALFKKYVGKTEYSFANRNSYFIILDNSIGNLSDGQFTRLEEELKKSSAYQHRFVIIHKAPLSLYQQSWFRPELSPWSRRFMKMCEDYKVDVVFSGHEHMFKDGTFGGTRYVMSGGGGIPSLIPTYDGGFLHYLVVRVYGDYVDYEVRRIFPPLWEFLTYYIWKDIFYLFRDVLF